MCLLFRRVTQHSTCHLEFTTLVNVWKRFLPVSKKWGQIVICEKFISADNSLSCLWHFMYIQMCMCCISTQYMWGSYACLWAARSNYCSNRNLKGAVNPAASRPRAQPSPQRRGAHALLTPRWWAQERREPLCCHCGRSPLSSGAIKSVWPVTACLCPALTCALRWGTSLSHLPMVTEFMELNGPRPAVH